MTTADSPRVVVMNDTSGRSHHGCARVMRLLLQGLRNEGLQVTARSPARHDWAGDAGFLAALSQADLVVINGEGTLHHGRPAGARLLSVLDHPARGNRPVAVVNALWQDNPESWRARLAQCALVSARDARSRDAMAAQGVAARVVPDLSLSDGATPQPGPRHGLIVGDSVRHSARRALALAARRLHAEALVPTKTRRSALWRHWPSGPLLSALYHGASPFGLPPLRLARNEPEYLSVLGNAAMHLTGRFHAICLSIVTATPVLAVGSNSWKIEALLAEAGLDAHRLIPLEALPDLRPDNLIRPYSAEETAGMASFLTRARAEAAALFRDLSLLAHEGRA